jgi:uncharacterized glyoxalase superfamily protein PhnB
LSKTNGHGRSQNENMSSNSEPSNVWPVLSFRDARTETEFLTAAFGLEETVVITRDGDPSIIEHGEMRWPGGGPGIMFGSAGKDDTPFGTRMPGNDAIYVVCDDPDALYESARAAGAEVVRSLRDEDYGSRGFTVRDPEGILWSFGTYRGE